MPLAFSDSPPELPPLSLIQRVVPPFAPEEGERELAAFAEGGKTSVRSLEIALAAVGTQLTDFAAILDFGCGPGRIMRWLGPLAETTRLYGTDVDIDAIEWASAHIPFATFAAAPPVPPLPYDDHSFDLVINHSVFTHLDEERQDLWLEELRRVTRPGALLALSVHSTAQWNTALGHIADGGDDPEPLRNQLETRGHVFIAEDLYVGSSHPDWYHTAFHAPWYVFEHWQRFFDLRAWIDRGAFTQDLVVLQRRTDDAPTPKPIRRRASVAAVETPAPGGDPLAHAEQLLVAWPPPRTLLGRAKRAFLRSERDRQERIERALIAAIRESRGHTSSRTDRITSGVLEQHAHRMTLLERELRTEIAALRANGHGRDDSAST